MNARIGNWLIGIALAAIAVAFATLQGRFAVTEDASRWTWAAIATIAFVAVSAWYLWPRKQTLTKKTSTIVVFATQTGFAQELAQKTAAQIPNAVAIAIDRLSPEKLARFSKSYWIVSTTGEGDPPDMAMSFLSNSSDLKLNGHEYAVLALGDRAYSHFCAFGHFMSNWLRSRGADEVQPIIEVNNADQTALEQWQKSIGLSALHIDAPEPFVEWTLAERKLLNPDSLGWPTYLISLKPRGELPTWRAGDIAQIAQWSGAEDIDSKDWREYSIASIPFEGSLNLLVRLTHNANGEYGLVSGLLCQTLNEGDSIALRIRANPSFHAPVDGRPMILIGNGTGIAGLRSLIRARIGRNHRRNWLIFGERQREKDFYFEYELRTWHEQGKLEKLDVTFSRDPSNSYVYHALENNAETIKQWIVEGADIFVCGSRASMGADVDRVLRTMLGNEVVEQLIRENRYRRDVY